MEKSAMSAKYDIIGRNYAELRRPDGRIARIIESALGSAQTVLNVGAGTGSYEPTGRFVIAVEPSREMIRKRSPAAAEAIEASADDLPFDDNSFDASMAILTVHHWPDKGAGLREIRRVTRGRVVLLTFDPSSRPWLTDYLPELAALDEAQMPAMSDYERWLGPGADHAGSGATRLQRWVPVCLLAPACGLSRSAHPIRQLVLLGHQQRRSRVAAPAAGS
jgi:ubiquinone/menaquinone biosynthesis C-methylase UbiE